MSAGQTLHSVIAGPLHPWRVVLHLAGAAVLGGMVAGRTLRSDAAQAAEATPTGECVAIYSGRKDQFVGRFIELFAAAAGIVAHVPSAGTGEPAVTVHDEGDAPLADVFFAQDAGAECV